MPEYEFSCQGKCGVISITKKMSDPSPSTCPHCGGDLSRIYNCYLQGPVDSNQENENGGFGKFYPQAGAQFLDPHTKTKRNPASHARSRYDMMEKLKRRGAGVEKA